MFLTNAQIFQARLGFSLDLLSFLFKIKNKNKKRGRNLDKLILKMKMLRGRFIEMRRNFPLISNHF